MESGWQAVLLAGGATSLVGDPGGKEQERQQAPPAKPSNGKTNGHAATVQPETSPDSRSQESLPANH